MVLKSSLDFISLQLSVPATYFVLQRVSAESRFNNMTPSNLGIVFAPSLLRSPEETVAAIMNTKFASTAIELMIENHTALFGLTSSGTVPPSPPAYQQDPPR
ncbi:hypothetical protein AHF37_01887 [Paragonimus kellicotti]|nr:hypothetical protein AHF37_01887 [Paragonimus kellicotti]